MAMAYGELSTERQIGMSLGPIPISQMRAWCARRGLDDEAEDHLVAVVRTVDAETMRRESLKGKQTATDRVRDRLRDPDR